MKNICIIATSLKEYHILSPLMNEIDNDPDMNLVVITTQQHTDADIHIRYTKVEENGFVLEERATTLFPGTGPWSSCHPVDFEQTEYNRILTRLRPDIAIVRGNTHQSFSAALAASMNNIPLAHINGQESDFGTRNNIWKNGISKLAHFHFTAGKSCTGEILPEEKQYTIFNTGSLLIEKINSMNLNETHLMNRIFRFSTNEHFVLVSFLPEPDMGSENEKLFSSLYESVKDTAHARHAIVFARPEDSGLGRMINSMIDRFVSQDPEKTAAHRFTSIHDIACAVKNAAYIAGNSMETALIAANFKIPAVFVSPASPAGPCPGMLKNIKAKPVALEQKISPARKIKNIIKNFSGHLVVED